MTLTILPGAAAAVCDALWRSVHGFARFAEVAAEIGYFAHAIGETNDDLLDAAPRIAGPGFLLPSRNHDLLHWCLGKRSRIVERQTLMTIGLYNARRLAAGDSVLTRKGRQNYHPTRELSPAASPMSPVAQRARSNLPLMARWGRSARSAGSG